MTSIQNIRYVIASNPLTGASFGLLLLLVLVAALGPHVVPYNPLSTDVANSLQPPSWAYWFGTDHLGRDVFSRTVVATRLDLLVAFSAVSLSFARPRS